MSKARIPAGIVNRIDRNGNLRTETSRRDDFAVAASTTSSKKTAVYLDFEDGLSVALNGREARRLFQVLRTHYSRAGMSRR